MAMARVSDRSRAAPPRSCPMEADSMILCEYCNHVHPPRHRIRKRRKNAVWCTEDGCGDCIRARSRFYTMTRPGMHARHSREQRRRLWDGFLHAYGFVCACCGESERVFLTIDHIHNDGRTVRKRIGPQVNAILTDLRQRGWPRNEVRVLCFNCNSGHHRNGGECPHEARMDRRLSPTG